MRQWIIFALLLCVVDTAWAGHPPRFRRHALYLPSDGAVAPYVDPNRDRMFFLYDMADDTNSVDPVIQTAIGSDGTIHLGTTSEPALTDAADGTNAHYVGDGVLQYIETSSTSAGNGSTGVTVSGWFKVFAAPAVFDGLIVNFAAAQQGMLLRVFSTNVQPFFVELRAKSSGGVATPLVPGSNVTIGVWHHFAGVWDGGNGGTKLFVDGNLIASSASSAATGTMAIPRSWEFMRDPTGPRVLPASVYRVAGYNKVISDSDIMDQFLFTGPDNQDADSEVVPIQAP